LLHGEPIKIWHAHVVKRSLAPGMVSADLVVGCGEDALQVTELQRAGGRRLAASDFLHGRGLPPQTRLL
jgi:methionyl-tRNA formyltransferase